MKLTPEQRKGAHGTAETVKVGGVITNKEDAEASKKSKLPAQSDAEIDYDAMNKAELIVVLEEKGIPHDPSATRRDLLTLLKAA